MPLGWETNTKVYNMVESGSLRGGGGNLSWGWEIPRHPTLCMKHWCACVFISVLAEF